jgi:2-polyprenyl-3-methyl-5-hydroxy-6-metoxy-1,4-benzoquinol methylase
MKIDSERDVNELVWSAKCLAVVSAWSSLGLFDRMRAGPILRSEIEADARAVLVTLPILLHLELLSSDGERVALTPTAERLLNEGAMPTEQSLAMLRDLGKMATVLREGGPVRDDTGARRVTRGGTSPENAEQTARFLDMLYRISEPDARSTYAWLARDLPARGSVLDLGGGHGRYARAFADEGYAVTLFDQPLVVELAKQRHGDRLTYQQGDFHQVESFGGPYDLVLLCNIVHGEGLDANAALIARAAKSLRAGGRIALRDMFLDEHGHAPASAVFFGLTVLFYTERGASPSVRQAEDWFAKAGLGDFHLIADGAHQILTARRAR